MKSVAESNFLNLLKFHEQKATYINMLNASPTKHLFWKNALEANQGIREVVQHGWDVINGTMPMCQCVFQQAPCTDICKCKGECHNKIPELFFISDEELE